MSEQLSLAMTIIPIEFLNTLYMLIVPTLLSIIIGGPIGVLLLITSKEHLMENKIIHWILSNLVNIGRSIPFIILMVTLIPLTRLIIGTSLGTTASIIPLTFAASPFFARIVENSLLEIDKGVIEAAETMGSTPWQILTKVLIWETLPSLILGITNLMVNLIAYSAMAGTIGGGGLGKITIQYGYQRFNGFLMILTIVLLVILVQCIQFLGDTISKKLNKKIGRSLK